MQKKECKQCGKRENKKRSGEESREEPDQIDRGNDCSVSHIMKYALND